MDEPHPNPLLKGEGDQGTDHIGEGNIGKYYEDGIFSWGDCI